jgi:hypothetical protein
VGDRAEPRDAERAGPGAPTAEERRFARYSRDSEKVRFARQGQRLAFGREHCTDKEAEIATAMVRRSPGLAFDRALALLRAK